MATKELKRHLWMPLINKSENGFDFVGILSDDSIDREGEIIGKSALEKAVIQDNKIVGLIDHERSVKNLVCQWVDKRIENIDGHNALVAVPKWFESNPQTQIIKGMMKEGANIGLSIGAISKSEPESIEIDGKSVMQHNDIEIVETSFVAIPANKHAQALAIAKSMSAKNKVKNKEEPKMEPEIKKEDAPVEEPKEPEQPAPEPAPEPEAPKEEPAPEPEAPAEEKKTEADLQKQVEAMVEKRVKEELEKQKAKAPHMKAEISDDGTQKDCGQILSKEEQTKAWKGKVPKMYL